MGIVKQSLKNWRGGALRMCHERNSPDPSVVEEWMALGILDERDVIGFGDVNRITKLHD